MIAATPSAPNGQAPPAGNRSTGPSAPARRPRDERLDFFRGLTMFIIFIAHADLNPWNNWIPARFGFSSGTELFVFCSGLASALAFGSIFVRQGFGLGTARIAHRIWQVYWAQLGVVMAVIGLMIAAGLFWPDRGLDLDPLPQLLSDPATAIFGLVTLRWLPPYLDILPMYLVILALVPVAMGLAAIHRLLPLAAAFALHAAVWITGINLVGYPWTGAGWFFNPFAWQLVFFTGFAIGMGWLRPPPLRDRRGVIAAAVIVLLSVPVAFWGIRTQSPVLEALHAAILPGNEKTDLHWLRYVHFLALAYLVLSAIEPWRDRLTVGAAAIIVRVGQQSLATFLASLVAARASAIVFQLAGTSLAVSTMVNLAGIALVVATAFVVGWFKSSPWARMPQGSGASRLTPDRTKTLSSTDTLSSGQSAIRL
ncbi:OpgC family protein [Phreatobacter sp.]|uniref:OpgC family protein n=1 Tax=Phreatobacter sp. TaxID=1966341 RepID=UPI003F724373